MPSRSGSERLAELRRRAEARLRSAIGPRREVPAQDVSRLMGELEVHAVELELQNEELRATQVQLQDARDRYFQRYDLAPVGYLTLDREGTVLEANLQAARLLRRERGRLVGTRLRTGLLPGSAARLAEHLRDAFATGRVEECELPFVGPPLCQLRLTSQTVPGPAGSDADPRCATTLTDVTELVEAERAARRSEACLRSLLETTPDGVVSLSPTGTIESWNHAAELILGVRAEEALGRPLGLLLAPQDGADLQRDLRTGELRVIGARREVLARRGGQDFPLELRIGERWESGARAFTAVLRDLSGLRRLEDELRQSQKLEPVGRLASELAHEYRNLLMGIQGFTSMALDALQDSPARRYVEEVRAAAERGSALTAQLLAFTRREQLVREPAGLDALVTEVGQLLRVLLRAEVRLELDLQAEDACVLVAQGDLEQVLLNLAVNASDAMPRGGRLAIRTRLIQAGDGADRGALILVEDQGAGMDAETRARLFEPFFTTKAHGTGLGLAAVQRVVHQLGGRIGVDSVPGRGTTFSLTLPLARVAADQEPLPVRSGEQAPLPERAATVLAVEDERLVLVTVEHYLLRAGYTPLMAQDPRRALELAAEAPPGAIDLLLTDVSLPGMGGRDLAAAVKRRHPGVRVLYMSAFPRAQLLEEGRIEPGSPTLEKPFDEEQLARRLAELRA